MADIILILVIVLSAYTGSKRGFIRSLVGMASTIASLFISMILYNPVSNYIYNSSFGKNIEEAVAKFFEKNPPVETTQIPSLLSNGAQAITDGATKTVTLIIIGILSFILVAVLSKLVIKVVMIIMNVASKLPIIKQANSLLGAVVGAISGALVCYVFIGVIATLEASQSTMLITEMIKKSNIAILFYYDNYIANMLTAIFK